MVPGQRFCSDVAHWMRVDDLALVRLNSYLHCTTRYELECKLSPLDDILVDLYTDADWDGDAATTKSTYGVFLEIV